VRLAMESDPRRRVDLLGLDLRRTARPSLAQRLGSLAALLGNLPKNDTARNGRRRNPQTCRDRSLPRHLTAPHLRDWADERTVSRTL
jgi:hypothetical protein